MVYMVPQWLYPTNEAKFFSDLINCFNNLNSNIARQPPIHYMNIWNVVVLGCTRKIIIGVIRYPTSSPITLVTISVSGFVFSLTAILASLKSCPTNHILKEALFTSPVHVGHSSWSNQGWIYQENSKQTSHKYKDKTVMTYTNP